MLGFGLEAALDYSRARDGALAYDADKVTEKYWRPVLADIEAHLSEVKDE